MTYTLNLRFLVKLLVVAGLALGTIHFWHRRQASQQVELFRHLADTAKADGRPADEVRYLGRYLALRPADVDARERFGRLRYEQARTPKQVFEAFLVLEDALRRDQERTALRRHIVDVALDPRVRLIAEAQDHLAKLGTDPPTDGDIEGLRAVCFEAQDNVVAAAAGYALSIRLKPDRIESYGRLAFLLRRVKDPLAVTGVKGAVKNSLTDQETGLVAVVEGLDEALKKNLEDVANLLIKTLADTNRTNLRAHLLAAVYWQQFRNLDETGIAVAAAQRIAPDDAEVILAAAAYQRALVRKSGQENRAGLATCAIRAAGTAAARNEARAILDRGLRLHPALPALYQARAEVEADAGRLDEAEVVLQNATTALPDSVDLWGSAVEIRVRRNDPTGAERALARYREFGAPGAIADYQAARISALREEWLDAANTLSRVRDNLVDSPYAKPANLLLARCYERVGELDRRIEAFNQVVADKDPTDPLWVPATLGLAEGREALGQSEAALELYQTLTARVPEAWLAIARVQLGQEMRKSKENPDLGRVQDALSRASEALPPNTTQLVLLRADLLHLKKDTAGARKLLTDLRAKTEKDVDVWIALAAQDLREGNRDRALATLDEARQKLGDSVALRLARARLIDPKAPDAPEQLRALSTAAGDSFSKADQLRLARGLADIAAARGATDLTGELLERAAAVAPTNLGVQLGRFDRALQADDFPAAEAVMTQIRAIDGVDGTTYRAARAFYRLRQAQKDPSDTAALDEAGRMFEALAADRPGWSRITLGQAIVADLQAIAAGRQDDDRALRLFRTAVEQGEQGLFVKFKIMELLFKLGQFAEAEAVRATLPQDAPLTADLSRKAAEVSLRGGNPEGALTYANRAVKADSADYRDQLWLALVNWSADRSAGRWEAPLRKAVAGAQGDPAPLVTLVDMLVASGRRADAEKAIAQFADAVAPDRRALAKGQCLLRVGRVKEARDVYESAVRDRPDDGRARRAYASVLMQVGEFAAASAHWEQYRALPAATKEEQEQALLMVALCARMNQGGDYQTVREAATAAGLMEGGVPKAPEDGMPPDKLRSAAIMLSLQMDRASKVQAIRYIDKLETALRRSGQILKAVDRFHRGQLHAALNEADAARLHLGQAVAADPKNATYVAYYLAFLIQQQRADLLPEAEKWWKQLSQLQPGEFRTDELAARLAAARHQHEAARQALEHWEKKSNVPVERLAGVYEEIGLPDDAGRMHQLAVDRSKRPEVLLAYATFLGRQKRPREALERCEEARRQRCPPAALAHAGVTILYTTRHPDPAHVAQVAAWISEALPKAAADPAVTAALLNRQASILNIQAKYEETIAVYERLLKLNPRDALAMNNLGYLLATHRRDFEPALAWVAKAKSVIGPVPDLLDTEAMIHLARAKAEGKADSSESVRSLQAALALLEDVEVQAPSAVAYFHLAQAWLAAGDRAKAERAWNEAGRRNLSVTELHPLERRDYETIAGELKRKAPG